MSPCLINVLLFYLLHRVDALSSLVVEAQDEESAICITDTSYLEIRQETVYCAKQDTYTIDEQFLIMHAMMLDVFGGSSKEHGSAWADPSCQNDKAGGTTKIAERICVKAATIRHSHQHGTVWLRRRLICTLSTSLVCMLRMPRALSGGGALYDRGSPSLQMNLQTVAQGCIPSSFVCARA